LTGWAFWSRCSSSPARITWWWSCSSSCVTLVLVEPSTEPSPALAASAPSIVSSRSSSKNVQRSPAPYTR
jgi:hypothetical protein